MTNERKRLQGGDAGQKEALSRVGCIWTTRDFIASLRTAHHLKRMNCLRLEFSMSHFCAVVDRGSLKMQILYFCPEVAFRELKMRKVTSRRRGTTIVGPLEMSLLPQAGRMNWLLNGSYATAWLDRGPLGGPLERCQGALEVLTSGRGHTLGSRRALWGTAGGARTQRDRCGGASTRPLGQAAGSRPLTGPLELQNIFLFL